MRAQAQKAQADREAARLKPLAERKAIGQKEADDAASNAEFASANVRSAEAKLREVQLNLAYTNVAAPITGLTSRAPKSEGSLVNANDTLLTTIWQVHPIWVPFAIPESDQLALQKEVAAGRLALPKDNAFDVTIKLTDGTVFPRQGRINFADSRVNPSTGSVEYRAEIPNADGALKPGQFVRVKLAGAKRNERLRGAADRGARRRAGQVRLRRRQGQGRQGHRRGAPDHARRMGRRARREGRQPVDRRKRPQGRRPRDRRRRRQAAPRRAGHAGRRAGAPGGPPGGAAPPAKDKDAAPAGNAPAKKS